MHSTSISSWDCRGHIADKSVASFTSWLHYKDRSYVLRKEKGLCPFTRCYLRSHRSLCGPFPCPAFCQPRIKSRPLSIAPFTIQTRTGYCTSAVSTSFRGGEKTPGTNGKCSEPTATSESTPHFKCEPGGELGSHAGEGQPDGCKSASLSEIALVPQKRNHRSKQPRGLGESSSCLPLLA